MTEEALLQQLIAHADILWSQTQYWTSVSFGILIASHLAAKHLNWFVLATFIFIYTMFTVVVGQVLVLQIDNIAAIGADLEALQQQGGELSNIARSVMENSPVINDNAIVRSMRRFMSLGMFLLTIGYACYCKVKHPV